MIANGYQIIDLKGRKLEHDGTAPGLYAELEALEKMPVFINCTYKDSSESDVELVPFTSTIGTYGDYKSFVLASAYDFTTTNYIITVCAVNANDEIVIAEKTVS